MLNARLLSARYRQIIFFFARLILGLALWEIIFPRLGLGSWAKRTREDRLRRVAVRFRSMALRMGGVMIKVGQFLSTRVDVLPAVIISELSGLQDEVPPENFAALRKVAEAEFAMPLEQKFVSFDIQPLAAASLGQVHRAQLRLVDAGRTEAGDHDEAQLLDVVVKIQRPNIAQIIQTDLAALRTVGDWLRRYPPIHKRADVPALLEEFARILLQEIDYLAEGVNAETFAANFQDIPGVCVPRVIWSHTTRCTLTLEDVSAIKITDYTAITAAGVDRKEVASRLLDTYLKQIFEDGFFHADPHPGNLFVHPGRSRTGAAPASADPSSSSPWCLTFVDFGMVGHVPANIRLALREMLVAVGTKDAARVVKSYQMLGVLLPSADLQLLERAEERLFESFWGKNMGELRNISPDEVKKLAKEFSTLLYEMPFQVPHDLIFLVRTVGILSGMCTGLDPEFNIWHHLAPYAQAMIAEEGANAGGFWLQELGGLAEKIFALPRRTEAMLERVERGELVVRDVQLVEQVRQLERAVLRAAGAILFTGLLLGGVQLYINSIFQLAWLLWGGAALTLLWVLWGRK